MATHLVWGFQAANPLAVNQILMAFRDKLQHWLTEMSGYECQEVDGDCMLAFADAVQAVTFCLLVSLHEASFAIIICYAGNMRYPVPALAKFIKLCLLHNLHGLMRKLHTCCTFALAFGSDWWLAGLPVSPSVNADFQRHAEHHIVHE